MKKELKEYIASQNLKDEDILSILQSHAASDEDVEEEVDDDNESEEQPGSEEVDTKLTEKQVQEMIQVAVAKALKGVKKNKSTKPAPKNQRNAPAIKEWTAY